MQNIPFVPKAQEYIAEKGFTLEDIGKEYFKPVVSRAYQRILDAILKGSTKSRLDDLDVELLSYPVSIAILAFIKDLRLASRFAIAEARRIGLELRREHENKILEIARSISWDVHLVNYVIRDELYTFAIHFKDYLSAPPPNDPFWKLINRPLINGYVLIRKQDLARLIEEYARHYIYNKIASTESVRLPETLSDIVSRIADTWYKKYPREREEAYGGGVFPPCMRKLMEEIKRGQNISHMARFAIATFLLNIGYDVEEVIDLFRRVPDFNERITRYQVEHLAGLRGSKIKYLPPSCKNMKTFGLCPGEDPLCLKVRNPLGYYRLSMRRRKKDEQ